MEIPSSEIITKWDYCHDQIWISETEIGFVNLLKWKSKWEYTESMAKLFDIHKTGTKLYSNKFQFSSFLNHIQYIIGKKNQDFPSVRVTRLSSQLNLYSILPLCVMHFKQGQGGHKESNTFI